MLYCMKTKKKPGEAPATSLWLFADEPAIVEVFDPGWLWDEIPSNNETRCKKQDCFNHVNTFRGLS